MKLAVGLVLLFLGFAQRSWGQTKDSTSVVSEGETASAFSTNTYAVLGATPQQEALVRSPRFRPCSPPFFLYESSLCRTGSTSTTREFLSLEDVAFVYAETREGSTLQEALGNFRGVLVSDFYAAYDSLGQCAHQKCLVHLMRDVNDDLSKQPFNEEMKEIAQRFAGLLKPIIDTVDRFGLKARYLRRYRRSVEQFYDALSSSTFETEVAAGYKKRFEKNRNSLFTFLDHDGVPWNNNNVEHAIKALVRLSRSIGGQSSPRGMRDYLVLLSISQICRYRGVSFLNFLRSGQIDVADLPPTQAR